MFISGLEESAYQKAIKEKDYRLINQHLYRVQKLTQSDYYFRHHLETVLEDDATAREMKKFYRFKSLGAFFKENPHKVQISVLGKLILKD